MPEPACRFLRVTRGYPTLVPRPGCTFLSHENTRKSARPAVNYWKN